MPGVAKSTNRTVRSLDEVWELGLILSETTGESNAAVMNRALAANNESVLAVLPPAKRRVVERQLRNRLAELRKKDPIGRYAREKKESAA